MRHLELLIPAGDMQKLKFAFAYGADAVYAGIPRFSLRARENGFRDSNIGKAISYARGLGKKLYLTANILPLNEKVHTFMKKMDQMMEWSPDGFIMADPGLIDLVKEKYPDAIVHLSVQANTMNWASARFWFKQGISRVIMSREVSIDEIKEVKDRVPELEIECFVHGAICVAHSGRCLLSNYFNRRDANQGVCTNACRWSYHLYSQQDKQEDANFFLEEPSRPGQFMRIDEDEHGTYIMNAKDLMAIEYLEAMVKAGVDSFKIEGRTKSLYYVSRVTQSYRHALDDLQAGKPFNPDHVTGLLKMPHRGYTPGFLAEKNSSMMQRYDSGTSDRATQEFSGVIVEKKPGFLLVSPRNKIANGDLLEVLVPGRTSYVLKVGSLTLKDGTEVDAVHGGAGVEAWIPCEQDFSVDYALISKIIS